MTAVVAIVAIVIFWSLVLIAADSIGGSKLTLKGCVDAVKFASIFIVGLCSLSLVLEVM